MTLQECIDRYHAAQPAPDDADAPIPFRCSTLTPRGHAAVAIERLRHQLDDLSAEDLQRLGPLLADLLVRAARAATA